MALFILLLNLLWSESHHISEGPVAPSRSAGGTEHGLPSGCDSYYQIKDGKFVPAYANSLEENTFYVRYNSELNKFTWVNKGSNDPLLSKSKVQGWRVGFSNRNQWYELQEDGNWREAHDTQTPQLLRRNASGNTYIAEQAPDDWQSWGRSSGAAPSGPMLPIAPPTPETAPPLPSAPIPSAPDPIFIPSVPFSPPARSFVIPSPGFAAPRAPGGC